MIDLHCHLLPGIDDGASSYEESAAMARAFLDQGVTHVACTPHILPGVYHNTGPQIRQAIAELQRYLDDCGIGLGLVTGADNHVVPDFAAQIRSGHLLTLGDSRYVLVEPPHHVAPARLDELFFAILVAGYVPILTHPERLTWIEKRYDMITSMAEKGVWMQITSGSLRGAFGKRARYWAEKMLCEGLVQILATDAHNVDRRPPDLAEGRQHAAHLIGSEHADTLVVTHPRMVLLNEAPAAKRSLPKEIIGRSHHETSGNTDTHTHTLARRLRGLFGQ